MLNLFLSVFIGWPAIIATIIIGIIGLLRSDYRFLIATAILAVPFSWVLSGFPVVRSPFFLVPLIPFSAALALRLRHEMIAWILGIVYFLAVFLVFMAVLAGLA